MIPFVTNLGVALASLLCPTMDWDRMLARTAVVFLKRGMTQEQVDGALGSTVYGWQNKLGAHRVYPQYRLRVEFSAVSGLTRVRYVPYGVPPAGTGLSCDLPELPVD